MPNHTEFDGEVQMCVVHHHCGWCGDVTNHYCQEATKLRKDKYIVVPDAVNVDKNGL